METRLLARVNHNSRNQVFVDDGSTDRTAEIIQQYKFEKRVDVLILEKNSGKAEAVRLGLNFILLHYPNSKVVGFLDVDGAFSISDVVGFTALDIIKKIEKYDAIWSSRAKLAGREISRNPLRHFLARIISVPLSLKIENMPYYSQSGFKLFRKSPVLLKVLSKKFSTRWLFEIELMNRWKLETGSHMKIWEEPVMYWQDIEGSKIRRTEFLRIFIEFLKIILMKSH